ncbi:hypothetical protein [Haloarcula amylovorans]|nr:hypothetical protein [Halomicroarcula amylolytica]
MTALLRDSLGDGNAEEDSFGAQIGISIQKVAVRRLVSLIEILARFIGI